MRIRRIQIKFLEILQFLFKERSNRKKIEDYQNKIQEEANEFINKINFSDETNKKTEEIRSKYAIS